jgi:hypothetical protein
MRYQYLVCMVQQGRVTWVNGQWIGTKKPRDSSDDEALSSCPHPWEFLDAKGGEGWELVAATTELAKGELTGFFDDQVELTRFTVLYFKRASAD